MKASKVSFFRHSVQCESENFTP